jgi:hypothetical protein
MRPIGATAPAEAVLGCYYESITGGSLRYTSESACGKILHGNAPYLGVLRPTLAASVPVNPICNAPEAPGRLLLWPSTVFTLLFSAFPISCLLLLVFHPGV